MSQMRRAMNTPFRPAILLNDFPRLVPTSLETTLLYLLGIEQERL
jgi:hypothetical protein